MVLPPTSSLLFAVHREPHGKSSCLPGPPLRFSLRLGMPHTVRGASLFPFTSALYATSPSCRLTSVWPKALSWRKSFHGDSHPVQGCGLAWNSLWPSQHIQSIMAVCGIRMQGGSNFCRSRHSCHTPACTAALQSVLTIHVYRIPPPLDFLMSQQQCQKDENRRHDRAHVHGRTDDIVVLPSAGPILDSSP